MYDDTSKDAQFQLKLKPQNDIANKFLCSLDENAEAFTFQTFDDAQQRKPKLAKVLNGNLQQHLKELTLLQNMGAGVFVTINRTDLTGRKSKNIQGVRAFFVDLDHSPLESFDKAPISPHMVVESSPGRFHGYWFVTDAPLERFTEIQKKLVDQFGGDPQVIDKPRVMRLPGFFHQKGKPFLTKIIRDESVQQVSFLEFEKAFDFTNVQSNRTHPQREEMFSSEENHTLKTLSEKEMLKRKDTRPGAYNIVCPWADKHSADDLRTLFYLPGYNGYDAEGFQCFHDHCKDKTIHDLKTFLGLASKKNVQLPLLKTPTCPSRFPFDALGSVMGGAARAISEIVKAPDSICGNSILAAAALAVQSHADVSIDGRVHPSSLFLLTVAESGDRKSAVDNIALKPARDFERMLSKTYKVDKKKYQNQMELFKIKKQQLVQQKLQKSNDKIFSDLTNLDEPVPPLEPFILLEEPTYEGLVKLLACGQPSLGLFSDEGGRMVGGHAMNKENMLKSACGFSNLWDGKPVSRIRGGDENLLLYGRRLSTHLMIQEPILFQLVSNETLVGQGFLARYLMVAPFSNAGKRPYEEIDISKDHRIISFWDRMNFLLDQPHQLENPAVPNELSPKKLELDPKAKILWIKFHDSIDKRLSKEGDFYPIRRTANKAAEQALRIACVLASFENFEAELICESCVERAIQLMDFYLSEALRISESLEHDPLLELAQSTLSWMRRKAEEKKSFIFNLREIYRLGGPRGIRKKESALRVLKILVEHGWVEEVGKHEFRLLSEQCDTCDSATN
jgi:hypothetical protein